MQSSKFLRSLPWILAVFIAAVFVQSLFFKFSNSFETRYIFGTIDQWMQSLPGLSLFTPLGTSVVINEAGDRDGGNCLAWPCWSGYPR